MLETKQHPPVSVCLSGRCFDSTYDNAPWGKTSVTAECWPLSDTRRCSSAPPPLLGRTVRGVRAPSSYAPNASKPAWACVPTLACFHIKVGRTLSSNPGSLRGEEIRHVTHACVCVRRVLEYDDALWHTKVQLSKCTKVRVVWACEGLREYQHTKASLWWDASQATTPMFNKC